MLKIWLENPIILVFENMEELVNYTKENDCFSYDLVLYKQNNRLKVFKDKSGLLEALKWTKNIYMNVRK